jgi:ribosomal protein S17
MPKVNIWNTISFLETGRMKLLGSGQELFGTVVKHGVNDKTVTVRVCALSFFHKYRKPQYSSKNKQVHDEDNYCVTGDKVIIANCHKLSKTKAYYVKTILKPFGRPMTAKS